MIYEKSQFYSKVKRHDSNKIFYKSKLFEEAFTKMISTYYNFLKIKIVK